MKRLIWLLNFIPASALLGAIGCVDYYLLTILLRDNILENSIWCDLKFLTIIAVVTLVISLICAIVGGKIGYKYVEMGRSRRWHYRANEYDDYNDQLRNTLYWAGKFACFPIIVALLIFLVCEIYYLV